jgi:twitching motility protein PilT
MVLDLATVENILTQGLQHKASDIHITVGLPPQARVHGSLISLDFPVLTEQDTAMIVASLMNEKQAETFKTVGEVDFSYALATTGRFRVNAYHQKGCCACALRIVNSQIPKSEDLGLSPEVIELYKKKRGLILVTGPTGSGKSTTLASLIDKINDDRDAHVITLEDPIEYIHHHKKSMINQREVGLDTMSYAAALRGALREDPDVILVGEMRDLETISTAVTAAETGHLVLSTLHTIGAAATIDRIIDVFPPHQQQQIRVQLGMVLEAVISQQLMPTIDHKGRVAAFEVMFANSAIKNLIRESKTPQIMSIIQTNRKLGMITMDDAIYELFYKGLVSREEAITFAQDTAYMEKKIPGAGSSMGSSYY